MYSSIFSALILKNCRQQHVVCLLFLMMIPAIAIAQAVSVTTIGPVFNGAGDLAVDSKGDIFVANFFSSTITRVSPSGETSIFINSGINGASGNEFDPDDNLYQSNFNSNQISLITPDGQISTFAGPANGIVAPVGVTLDSSGVVYVANCGNQTITRHPGPLQGTVFASGNLFQCPNGITVDDQDNIYVANFNNGNVIKITPAGEAAVFANIPGNNNGHITFANGVLYVAGLAGHQMWQLDLDGQRSLISGTGTGGNLDGAGEIATHFRPNGVDHSPDGRILYINDVEFPDSDGSSTPNIVREIVLHDHRLKINAGLNDAWFNPATNGQGFFITVFPELGVVTLAWFTYDTALPDGDATANLGDPGHRWLTALGTIDGHQSVMNITITSGGIFDTSTNIERVSDGTITLRFENCNSGSVDYNIPSIGRQGSVPIQRVANDNIALCEALDAR